MGSIVSSIASVFTGGSGGTNDSQEQELLQEEQQQFAANFELQTRQAMADNTNQTMTAISQGHSQAAASSTAGAREVADANSKIVA